MKNFTSIRFAAGAILFAAVNHASAQTAPPPRAAQAQVAPGPNGTPAYGTPTATTFTSKIGFITMDRDPGASYPRVIQLKIGPNKGALLATYSHRGNLPIYRSTDNGESWTLLSEVPQLRGQPCLYELPAKMGEMPAGT